MKQFSLEEYLKNPSKKVVTRDRKAVKIHCINYDSPQPIIAEIEGHNHSQSFTKDGKYFINGKDNRDLFFVTEKHEKWVNVYLRSNGDLYFGNTYSSKKEAKDGLTSHSTYITTVKIEWEE